MKKNIVISAGAGTSKAVDNNTYPTTIEFFKRLPGSIKKHSFFQYAVQFIKAQSDSPKQIDIEMVLWELQELRDFFISVNNSSKFIGWMLSPKMEKFNKACLDAGVGTPSSGNFNAISSSVERKINTLIDSINENVYKFYGSEPTKEQLSGNWIPLLKYYQR